MSLGYVKRSAWKIMFDTIHALLMREVKTRFGNQKLGYFWALAEPVAQASILALIFTLLGREALVGIPIALFLFAGILPFNLFSKLLPQLANSVDANKALLSYRQVTAIDPIITRIIIEVTTFIIVYVLIVIGMAWLGFNVVPEHLLDLALAITLLITMTAGLGLVLCSAVSYWPDVTKLISLITRPLFFMSGILYCATMVPEQYWYLLSWNPVFHAIELIRDAYFVEYQTPLGSWGYLSLVAGVSLCSGLITFKLSQQRFIAS